MFRKIVLFLAFSSAILTAQYSAIYGSLIRIPFDAVQINPADTMGSWYYQNYSYGDVNAGYIGNIHSPQITYFIKDIIAESYTGVGTALYLEDFINQTSVYGGGWQGYNDVPEPYDIFTTVPFRVDNGNWLMNGNYNMSFISDEGNVTIISHEYLPYLLYISGKIGDKYLTVFNNENSPYSYDYYLLDLSNSPDFDTTGAEKIYFDIPVTPRKIFHISGSLYIAGIIGIDSMDYGSPGIYLFKLENNTFHFVKQIFSGLDEDWYYRDGYSFVYDYPNLFKYEYNPADTSFINGTLIVTGYIIINRDFSYASQMSGNNLLIYNLNTAQLLNTIDISGLWNPGHYGNIVDSPYVYLSQYTRVTGVKDKSFKPLSYDLQIYPNPFNPSANIEYTIPERAIVHIKLFDILGKEVREIFAGESTAGNHRIKIDGAGLAAGIYFVNFDSEKYMVTKKVVLLK